MGKERREILYSIIVIILVPVLLATNTILFTSRVRSDFKIELGRKADVINSILAESVKQHLSDQKAQQYIDATIAAIASDHPEVKNIMVITPAESGYTVLATTADPQAKITSTDSLQYDIVIKRKRAVAKLIHARTASGKATRAWQVATPVVDESGTVLAIVSSDVLTADADELINNTFTSAYIILIISTLVLVLLLIRHFRFVAYADLLRRQKEVNQTMSDFLSVATHELKAPMSIIKGYTSNVLDGDFGEVPPTMRDSLHTVIKQTDRLNNLVTDLLNVSRIEQGRITFDMKTVDMSVIIQTLLADYGQKAKEKGIDIDYEKSDQPPLVFADEGRVQEIMTNLIDNAIKYSLKGSVTIRHSEKGGMLFTSVRDTGIGMSSEERSRLFQRFYRVKNDQTKNISGTGLGLWIIKQYIEKMGGTIQVDSMINVGTEFTVALKKPPKDSSRV